MEVKITLGNYVYFRREELGMSKEMLADLVGSSVNTINMIEHCKYNPTTLLALKIACALNCKVDDLFTIWVKEVKVDCPITATK